MVICKECGNSAESTDGFCSSCGALLEWSGQPVAGPVSSGQALASRQPVAERTRPGPVPLATEPAYTGPYCSACGVRNPEGRTFCRSCGGTLRPGAAASQPGPGWWRRLMSRLRGRPPYAAGERPRGFLSHDTPRPVAVAPAASPSGRPTGRAALPQSTGAPATGTSSRPARLDAGNPAAGTSSRSARLNAGNAAMSTHSMSAAGQRVRRASQSRRMLLNRFAPVLLVASLLGIGLGPGRAWLTSHVLHLEHRAQTQLSQQYVNVVPVRASASSAAPGHGAMLAIDGIQQTYWLSGGTNGAGARLRIRFASPQDIARVGLLSGEPGGSYTAQARPQTIKLIVAGQPPVTLSFDDTASFQNRPVSLQHVTVITAVITSVYPGQQGQAVAVRELEFFSKV
jgi:hypothetical protein